GRRIAGAEQAWQVGRLILSSPDRALIGHFAPELPRELGLLGLTGVEEEGAADGRFAAGEDDPDDIGRGRIDRSGTVQPDEALFADFDAEPVQARKALCRDLRGTIRAKHQIAAPAGE